MKSLAISCLEIPARQIGAQLMAGNKQRIWENQVSNLDTDIYLNHTIKLACFRYAENNNHVFKTAYLY